ncbi:MAG: hypothetical protein PWR01_2058 [Clostridiales bacterium]|jgi:uncharacterized protein (DUF885 family)|nr:hypothetical protein [Clostridiales bacterium]MDN5280985.1 hypothetical protein [Candidatus Ozemobacter sp.]
MRCKADYSHPGFEKISSHFYKELLSRNPVTATWLGEHLYDGILSETGADAVERNCAFLREMRDAFSALPEQELTIAERLDREIAINFASTQLFLDEDMKRWKMGRDLAMNIGDSLFLLFARDFAPLHDRIESVISRLKAVPMYLMSGKTLFQTVPALWGEIFLESLANLPDFISIIEQSVKGKIPQVLSSELEKAANSANKAIGEFRTWFTHAIMPKADHDWAMGESAFQAFIGARRIGLSNREMLELADKTTQQARVQLEVLTQTILGKATGSCSAARNEALKRIKNHCPPSFELALSAYREAMLRSREWVRKNDFATLPDNEELEIIETPDFMTHLIPFSAYIGPERTAKTQKGTYLLTRDKKGTNTTRYNYAEIANSALHEGYPGHHLQLTGQNLHPGRFRIFADNLEIIEGWAHYCEEQLKSKGFYRSNEEAFTHSLDQLFHAARIKIEINLQCKSWTFDQATQFLMEETGIDKTSAIAEIRRYSQNPGCQISYIIGKELLTDLKQSLKNQFSTDFTDKIFHDLIIYEGSIPAFMGRKYYPEIIEENLKIDSRT